MHERLTSLPGPYAEYAPKLPIEARMRAMVDEVLQRDGRPAWKQLAADYEYGQAEAYPIIEAERVASSPDGRYTAEICIQQRAPEAYADPACPISPIHIQVGFSDNYDGRATLLEVRLASEDRPFDARQRTASERRAPHAYTFVSSPSAINLTPEVLIAMDECPERDALSRIYGEIGYATMRRTPENAKQLREEDIWLVMDFLRDFWGATDNRVTMPNWEQFIARYGTARDVTFPDWDAPNTLTDSFVGGVLLIDQPEDPTDTQRNHGTVYVSEHAITSRFFPDPKDITYQKAPGRMMTALRRLATAIRRGKNAEPSAEDYYFM